MNLGHIANKIKNRSKPKDTFYTPCVLAKKHIEMIEAKKTDIWYDDSAGKMVYFDNFPTPPEADGLKPVYKYWSEITKGKNLFHFNTDVDIICGNPPYSILTDVMCKSISLNPRIISYLIGQQNFTPYRLKMMRENGYGLTKIHICKVRGFFGYSYICVWEKDKKDNISYETQNYYGELPLCPELDKYGNLKKK